MTFNSIFFFLEFSGQSWSCPRLPLGDGGWWVSDYGGKHLQCLSSPRCWVWSGEGGVSSCCSLELGGLICLKLCCVVASLGVNLASPKRASACELPALVGAPSLALCVCMCVCVCVCVCVCKVSERRGGVEAPKLAAFSRGITLT